MKVGRATREHETWLGNHLRIVPDHLRQKHRNMASDPFVFLRATFYRWAQTWPEVCRDQASGPVVLEAEHPELRKMALSVQREPARFWQKLDVQVRATARSKVPPGAIAALERVMPESGLRCRIVRRQAGQGSLGRQRFVALALWHGGRIALEAKALAPRTPCGSHTIALDNLRSDASVPGRQPPSPPAGGEGRGGGCRDSRTAYAFGCDPRPR